MPQRPFFYRETSGIRITVRPSFLADQSRPSFGRFVFAYQVRIENVGAQPAQLVSRRWDIHDSIGEDSRVEGEGVVGQQPLVRPGGVYEYSSYCVLKSRDGHMEGAYRFVRADGTTFEALVPRFVLHRGDDD